MVSVSSQHYPSRVKPKWEAVYVRVSRSLSSFPLICLRWIFRRAARSCKDPTPESFIHHVLHVTEDSSNKIHFGFSHAQRLPRLATMKRKICSSLTNLEMNEWRTNAWRSFTRQQKLSLQAEGRKWKSSEWTLQDVDVWRLGGVPLLCRSYNSNTDASHALMPVPLAPSLYSIEIKAEVCVCFERYMPFNDCIGTSDLTGQDTGKQLSKRVSVNDLFTHKACGSTLLYITHPNQPLFKRTSMNHNYCKLLTSWLLAAIHRDWSWERHGATKSLDLEWDRSMLFVYIIHTSKRRLTPLLQHTRLNRINSELKKVQLRTIPHCRCKGKASYGTICTT